MKRAIGFILLNFGAPLAFFVVFRAVGAKPAIAMAVLATLIQAATHWIYSIRMSPFYLVASAFTLGFGMIDLVITSPRFFRLEPFAQNLIIGMVFLVSLTTRYSLLGWFAAGLPEVFRPKLAPEILDSYLRKVTWIWGIYFLLKAFLFLYLAFQVDLGELVLLRSVIGGGSLVAMVVGEIIFRRRFLPGGLRRSERIGSDRPASEHPSSGLPFRGGSLHPR